MVLFDLINKCISKTHIPPYGTPEKSTWCHVQGHNFTVPEDIARKISKDLPGILAMPPVKFHADQ